MAAEVLRKGGCLFGPVNELSTRDFTHFTHSGTEVFS